MDGGADFEGSGIIEEEMKQKEFFEALSKLHGKKEPLNETVSVLSYEVGRMLEQAMYLKWYGKDKARMGFLKSELMDAIAQCVLICESIGADFDEMKDYGIEKAMERFTGKERK